VTSGTGRDRGRPVRVPDAADLNLPTPSKM